MTVDTRARAHDRRYFGVAVGVVTANGDPDKQGRVKLNFPWFDGGRTETDWCRVVQLYAGGSDDKVYGSVFVPEVGDEVLVAFDHGDMRFPYVIGGLYNGEDLPPVERSSSKDVKMIRTKGGHELYFDDGERSRAVHLKTAGGYVVELDDQNQRVRVSAGSSTEIVLDSSGISIKGSAIKLQADSVQIGNGAAEPVVLGTQLLTAIATHTHNVTMVGAPSGPPVPPITNAILSQAVQTK